MLSRQLAQHARKKLVGTWPTRVSGRSSSPERRRSHRTIAQSSWRPPTRRPPPTARSGCCQQEGDAPTIKACLHHTLVIKTCDVPWRQPKTPPMPLPPPQPLPSRQWQPTHQLTHLHFRASGGSHPPFTRDLESAADEMSTAAREMNGDLAGSWLWEAVGG